MSQSLFPYIRSCPSQNSSGLHPGNAIRFGRFRIQILSATQGLIIAYISLDTIGGIFNFYLYPYMVQGTTEASKNNDSDGVNNILSLNNVGQ